MMCRSVLLPLPDAPMMAMNSPSPTVIEQPRSTIGLAYLQGFRLLGLDCSVKVSGENLNDAVWEYTQGGEIYRSWKPGRVYGFTFGLTFF